MVLDCKIVWMCWFQGEDDTNIPVLNKKCIERWKHFNTDWRVNILNANTIEQYLPEYFEILKNSPERPKAAKSDLIRILLLSKYGGVWVDASVYPMVPLSDFYTKIVNHTKFFAYRFIPRGSYDNRKKCETVSWFLCAAEPKLYLIEKWKEAFVTKFKTMRHWPYFTFHETLTGLYDTDATIKALLDDMVQINEKIPHSAQHLGMQKQSDWIQSYMYKRPPLAYINAA